MNSFGSQNVAFANCGAVNSMREAKMIINRPRGVTVVEIIVVIALAGLIGTAVMRFFSSANTTRQNFSQKAMLQMDSRKAFDHIIDQIREGIDVIRPSTGETTQYLVFKDLINQMTMLYLEPNDDESRRLKKNWFTG